VVDDDVAPAMGLMNNLFQKAEFTINGKTVSRLDSRFAEVASLETRMNKSKSWLDSIGASTNFWQDDFKERQAQVTADGEAPGQPVPDIVTPRAQLGPAYVDDAKVQYNQATGVVTFTDGAGPAPAFNLVNDFEIGDCIRFIAGAGPGTLNIDIKITAVAANTLQTERNGSVAVADDTLLVNQIVRVRKGGEGVEPARQVGIFELIWQPPLSIFKVGHALPTGDYELILYPENEGTYQKRAVESSLADKSPGSNVDANDFNFKVKNMFLYTAVVEGPRADNLTYLLDLDETHCQVKQMDQPNLSQKQFDVSPSTHAMTVAFQDGRQSNTLGSSTKFVVGAQADQKDSGDELNLTRLFVQYAGESKPSPDADPSFVAGKDHTVQRYVETQMATGGYHDTGGAESIQDWHGRGAYYTLQWPKDGKDRSTRVIVNADFSSANTDRNLLLFSHAKSVAQITIQDGRVVNVAVEQA
jgi:hypothetical protein